jgi:hypothetical protein
MMKASLCGAVSLSLPVSFHLINPSLSPLQVPTIHQRLPAFLLRFPRYSIRTLLETLYRCWTRRCDVVHRRLVPPWLERAFVAVGEVTGLSIYYLCLSLPPPLHALLSLPDRILGGDDASSSCNRKCSSHKTSVARIYCSGNRHLGTSP